MKTEIEKQQETVARMEQSPCQCLIYHVKPGTERYSELLKEWQEWREISRKFKGNTDKQWILFYLLSSQNCPDIKEEQNGN